MSKSMWIDAQTCKPELEGINYSISILFWPEKNPRPFWGWYDYVTNRYYDSIDHYFAGNTVKYFAYISNPYK